MAAVNAKSGPFTFAICIGDLFGSEPDDVEMQDLIAGRITVPIECFVVMGGHPLPASIVSHIQNKHGEICPNLVFIGAFTHSVNLLFEASRAPMISTILRLENGTHLRTKFRVSSHALVYLARWSLAL